MSKEKDIEFIINSLIDHYGFKGLTDFANYLGVKPQTLSSWLSRGSINYDLIYAKCEEVDANFLMSGTGSITKRKENRKEVSEVKETDSVNKLNNGIPLIPLSAMAGSFNGEMNILEYDCEHFVVPTFKGADFLISVKGSSMYPKYSPGDIVACKKLAIDTFFQWNKVYVIDTDQGPLIKRVKKGSSENMILIVSDNHEYDPFELSRSSIYHIALVLGVIRLE